MSLVECLPFRQEQDSRAVSVVERVHGVIEERLEMPADDPLDVGRVEQRGQLIGQGEPYRGPA